jgi:hypothetical protein
MNVEKCRVIIVAPISSDGRASIHLSMPYANLPANASGGLPTLDGGSTRDRFQRRRKDNLREKKQECRLWHVNSFEYFDHTPFG